MHGIARIVQLAKMKKKMTISINSITAKSTKSSQFDVLTMRLPFQKKEKR